MLLDSVICGSKESASTKLVKGWNETCALKEKKESFVVLVCAECVDESGRLKLCGSRGSCQGEEEKRKTH